RQVPAFSATSSMLMPSTNVEQQRDELYEILAYRIPALSPAMGKTEFHPGQSMFNILSLPLDIDERIWPRIRGAYANRWLYSDIKNLAFLYVFEVFQTLKSSIGSYEEL
ncbi:MAG: hypothetical protein ACI4RT_08570, partial [Candidatus Spyradenecus sp.]